MSLFWDATANWRDQYYEQLLALPPSQTSRAQAAEQAYCTIEMRTVDRLMKNSHSIADLGCGTGRVTWRAAESYDDKTFVGVDISSEQLQVYWRRLSTAARRRVSLINSSVSDLIFPDDTFDLALFCNHTFGAILGTERTASLIALRKALSTGGRLLIAGFSNLELAADCYRNWQMHFVSMDRGTGLIELARHYSLWEPASAVRDQLTNFGFRLSEQTDFELGYVQLYVLANKCQPRRP